MQNKGDVMDWIFTVGTGNRSSHEFLTRLHQYKIDWLVDIRRAHCRSWNRDFAWDNIGEFFRRIYPCSHATRWLPFPKLSNPKDWSLACFKDWIEEEGYSLVKTLADILIEKKASRPALMCSELHAYELLGDGYPSRKANCHRVHVASKLLETMLERDQKLGIINI